MIKTLFVLIPLFISSFAFGMSVSWQGSTAVMMDNQSYLNDWLVAYSFKSNAAVAAHYMRMLMRDGSEMRIYAPQLNYLVHRWNGRDFQASVYTDAGFGAESFQGRTSTAGVGTFDADIESRSLYAAERFQVNLVGVGSNTYQNEVRLGAAPYKAEFEEIATWLIVCVQNNPQFLRTFAVTPMVRLFYKEMMFEAGSSTQGDWMFDFMIHY